jgi:hypothetical protein
MAERSLRKTLGIVASIAFLGWCVYYASTDATLLPTARSARWEFLILAMLFQLFCIANQWRQSAQGDADFSIIFDRSRPKVADLRKNLF